jgi:pyruvate,water dikinase
MVLTHFKIRIDRLARAAKDSAFPLGGKARNALLLERIYEKHTPQSFIAFVGLPLGVIEKQSDRLVAQIAKKLRKFLDPEMSYAVRSSASVEDGSKLSFAGQFESFLGVRGIENVARSVIDVYKSAGSIRAEQYRSRTGHNAEFQMTALIQSMVYSEKAGILFTINPITGADECVINAAYGLGDKVVGGEITPDEYRVLPNNQVVTKIGSKALMSTIAGDRVLTVPVPTGASERRALKDAEAVELANFGRSLAEKVGYAADIEWAIADGQVWLLQIRPVTGRLEKAGASA